MQFDEAKTEIRTAYERLGFAVVDEHSEELFLERQDGKLKVGRAEIEQYADLEPTRAALRQAPNACSVTSIDYREQLVRLLDPLRGPYGFLARKPYIFGDRDGAEPFLVVGAATSEFVHRLRFDSDLVTYILRLRRAWGREEFNDYPKLASRLLTIRVHRLGASSIEDAGAASDGLIDGALFAFAYLKGVSVGIVDAWPGMRFRARDRPFRAGERHMGSELPLPRTTFNREILRFYQLGVSTDVAVLQFLSFYQVLEYFFTAVADSQLYERLRTRLNDPRFRSTPLHLDRIIQDVAEHNRVTDETEMLRLVLTKYVTDQELIEFIEAYEAHLGEPYYTRKRSRFGAELEVRLQTGHVIGNVAKVIKAVRNALVHSSDRHERSERHVPFSKGSEVVEREVPLLRFLAERVIIASAT